MQARPRVRAATEMPRADPPLLVGREADSCHRRRRPTREEWGRGPGVTSADCSPSPPRRPRGVARRDGRCSRPATRDVSCSHGRRPELSCITANDLQLARLADAIAQRVGQQRFHVWFNNSTRLDLRQDGLEIAVPNDFISEWIGKNFTRPIQEAAHEVLGTPLQVRFSVVPELFEVEAADRKAAPCGEAPAKPNGSPRGKGGKATAKSPAARDAGGMDQATVSRAVQIVS